MTTGNNHIYKSPFNIAVLVAGIGFFIDAFDLFLFNVYRIPSLKDLGLSGVALTDTGERLLSIQMAGGNTARLNYILFHCGYYQASSRGHA